MARVLDGNAIRNQIIASERVPNVLTNQPPRAATRDKPV